MKKLFIYIVVMMLMLNLAFALGVERTIENNKVTLKITGYSNRFGGIISETLPIGYLPAGIQSFNVGISGSTSGKLEGQLYEIAFISDNVNPATIVYGISGSGSGTISGSYAFESGQTGIISGQSQLGSTTTNCIYDSICDKQNSCGATRNTDGIICGANQQCNNGACTTSNTTQQITCYKKGEFGCTSYQVTATNCGNDYATQEVCQGTKSCSQFIRNLPMKINMPADCDAGVVMIILSIIGGIVIFLILKGVFK